MQKNTKKTTGVVVTKKNTVAIQEDTPQVNPVSLIAQAMDKGVDMEKMERLFDLQERWEKREAKKAFDQAMANFQGECPVIEKKTAGAVTGGKVAYYFANLGDIVSQVKDILTKNGLSYITKVEVGDKVKATCIIRHIAGHEEKSIMEVPLGTKTGIMSETQRVAAATTFAKRYAFTNALGIMTGDVDTDAQNVDLPENETLDIMAQFDECSTDEEAIELWKKLTVDQRKDKSIILHVKKIRQAIKNNKK